MLNTFSLCCLYSCSQTLEWCIPMILGVALAFLIITSVIVYTLYRQKKYGAFCCLMPVSFTHQYTILYTDDSTDDTVCI